MDYSLFPVDQKRILSSFQILGPFFKIRRPNVKKKKLFPRLPETRKT